MKNSTKIKKNKSSNSGKTVEVEKGKEESKIQIEGTIDVLEAEEVESEQSDETKNS